MLPTEELDFTLLNLFSPNLATQLSSWDEDEADYASNYSAPRSYVTAISEVLDDPPQTCLGHAKNDAGEARFDSEFTSPDSHCNNKIS